MSRLATYATEEGLVRNPNSPKPDEILAQLRSILASPSFLGSKRCHQFLEYVCEKSLAGKAGALKERAIAIEVFGRQPDAAGQGEDTIVRVGAREVRKRLAQYYVTPEGTAATVLIELPPGSYAPEFRYSAAVREQNAAIAGSAQGVAAPVPAVAVPVTTPATLPGKHAHRFSIGVACFAAVAAGTLLFTKWIGANPGTEAFQHFWAPVFQSSAPFLIGVGHPIVYQPSKRASRLNAERQPPGPFPLQEKLTLLPKELDGSDIIPVMNQFVGFGDMVAANEVSQMLARSSRTVRVMLASSIPFADLRQSQAYLIGSLTNHWTMELGQNWRYQFGWTPDHVPVIKDTQSGSQRQWATPSQEDGSTPEDYSLICRIRNSPTSALLIISAGIKQFGTEAAGRLLAQPAELGTILNKLPPGWEDRNLQLVLHMRVIGNTPAAPEVVASYVW